MPSPCFSFDMFWSFREMSITCWSAKEWDDAVKEGQGQSSLCSLACVFLTDKQSGARRPRWRSWRMRKLFLPSTLWEGGSSSLPQRSRGGPDGTEVVVPEKRCWGHGPGSPHSASRKWCFLDRKEERSTPWKRPTNARRTATARHGGAVGLPSGKKNVDKARKQGQKFHVFYFEGKVGCGKMAWEDRAGFDKNRIESQKKQLARKHPTNQTSTI